MENKYLPIGTICTLKNNNKKIMIISYFSIEYNGNVKMYDYKGCVYPEGLLLPSQAVSFDHSDIENVDFIGYKNEQFEVFNNSLNREKNEEENYEQKPFMSNFKFDENGVVVFDGTGITEDETASVTEKLPVFNPFKQEYQKEDVNKPNTQNSIFKFDENGVVISDGTVSTEQPTTEKSKYQFDENGFVISDGTATNDQTSAGNSQFQFDENGVVISDGTAADNQTSTENTQFQFDENGVVISDGTATNNSQTPTGNSQFQFDENGIVISDGTETNNDTAPAPEKIEEIKPETSGIKFDENGIVISE